MSPIGTIVQPLAHKFSAPPFEEAEVVDVMRMGIISCPHDATVPDIARTMATYRMHCVLVRDSTDAQPVAVVTDLALAAAAGEPTRTARDLAVPAATVKADEPLSVAARRMADEGVGHLLVIQPATHHALGVLSTLDVADALAWSPRSGS